MKKVLGSFLMLALLSVAFIGCSENSTTSPLSSDNNVSSLEKKSGGQNTIVAIASSNPDFEYLVAAVQFAGLVDVLNGNRQFTVFAPTDQAFEDLAAALELSSVADLLVEENKQLVTNVLLYHVSPGNKYAEDVLGSGRVNTLLKKFIYSKVEDEMPMVGNDETGFAGILAVDLKASNGTIHVIDKVLLPQSGK